MEDKKELVFDLPNGAIIYNDLGRPLTQISRSRQYCMLNISVTVQIRDICNGRRIGTRTQSTEWCHFQTVSDP